MEGKRLERRENKRDEDDEQKVRREDTIHVHMSVCVQSNLSQTIHSSCCGNKLTWNLELHDIKKWGGNE